MPETTTSNVFISWSGKQSRAVAKALYDWLPQVVNAIRPWMSTEDIRKGSRWNEKVARELASTQIGVFCLTPDNMASPWLLFEAGAISRALDAAYVCPYLFDIKPSDVPQGPLSQFQLTVSTRDETMALVQTINEAIGSPRSDAEVESAFNLLWPALEKQLEVVSKTTSQAIGNTKRSSEDMLEEVLQLVREMSVRHSDWDDREGIATSLDVASEKKISDLAINQKREKDIASLQARLERQLKSNGNVQSRRSP